MTRVAVTGVSVTGVAMTRIAGTGVAVTGVLLAAGFQRSGSLTCKPAGLDSHSALAVAQLRLPSGTVTALWSCSCG